MKNKLAEKFIEEKGGAAAVARAIKLESSYPVQTVHNWKSRGVPEIQLLRHKTFFRDLIKQLRSVA